MRTLLVVLLTTSVCFAFQCDPLRLSPGEDLEAVKSVCKFQLQTTTTAASMIVQPHKIIAASISDIVKRSDGDITIYTIVPISFLLSILSVIHTYYQYRDIPCGLLTIKMLLSLLIVPYLLALFLRKWKNVESCLKENNELSKRVADLEAQIEELKIVINTTMNVETDVTAQTTSSDPPVVVHQSNEVNLRSRNRVSNVPPQDVSIEDLLGLRGSPQYVPAWVSSDPPSYEEADDSSSDEVFSVVGTSNFRIEETSAEQSF